MTDTMLNEIRTASSLDELKVAADRACDEMYRDGSPNKIDMRCYFAALADAPVWGVEPDLSCGVWSWDQSRMLIEDDDDDEGRLMFEEK